MGKYIVRILIGLAVLLVVAGAWLLFFDGGASNVTDGNREYRSQRIVDGGNAGTSNRVKANRKNRVGQRLGGTTQTKVEKPDFSTEADEESKLIGEMKRLFMELQAALDAEDKKRVFALVHKLQSMDEWPDGIPKSVKLKALDALAWFGASGMAEAVGFLADGDSEVVETTVEKFEEMLCDMDAGDRAISDILKQIVKVVHDRDALDSFYMEMNNMRDTVRAETALAIFDSGNADAVAVLKENVDFYFSDIDKEQITREDIEQFRKDAEQAYKDNPEKAQEDEEFYNPPKD